MPSRAAPNAARNAGWQAAGGELVMFVDDDVEAPRTWLPALLAAAAATPERDVFAGPIRADIEGGGPRSCGRDTPPITTLDHGAADVDVAVGWSANLAIRRAALETVGGFDESIPVGAGDEEEWQERYRSTGGRVRYVAAAGLDHRRAGADATLRALARAQYHRGRAARSQDVRKGVAPSLAGRAAHGRRLPLAHARRACPTASRSPRTRWAARARRSRPIAADAAATAADRSRRRRPNDWASGESGIVGGVRLGARTRVEDALLDARRWATLAAARGSRAPRARRRRAAACWRSGSSARTART